MDQGCFRVCRICFEEETTGNPLFSPCKCTGSSQFIHESCLNSWIRAQDGGQLRKQCEVCKYFFKIHALQKVVCDPRNCIERNPQQVCYCCILMMIFAILLVLLYVVIQKDYANPKKSVGMFLGIILGFFALFFCALGVMVKLLKAICLVQVDFKYKIFPINELNELNSTNFAISLHRSESLVNGEYNLNQLEEHEREHGY